MIALQDLTPGDGERLFTWRREPEVDRWMVDLPVQSREAHEAWLQGFLTDPDRRGWIILQNQRPAGFLSIMGLKGRHRRGEWGWYVAEASARGRGVGRAAQALGLDLAFNELGLEKVWAEVLAGNDTALRAQAAAGFRREGYLRRHVLKDGAHHDVVLLAILADEWRQRRVDVRKSLIGSNLIAA